MTTEDVSRAITEYYRSASKQRLGQYLINNLPSITSPWPELFYEEDNEKAKKIVYTRMIYP